MDFKSKEMIIVYLQSATIAKGCRRQMTNTPNFQICKKQIIIKYITTNYINLRIEKGWTKHITREDQNL